MAGSTIDQSVFDDLKAAAGEEFVVELVDAFLEDAPQMLLSLREALSTGDTDSFRRAAHSMKSNASTFGAAALADASRNLELGGLPSDDTALNALQTEFDCAAVELTRLAHG